MRVRPWRASLLIAATLVASAGGKAQKSSYRVPAIEALAECEHRLMLAHATTDAVHAEFAERFALQSLKAMGCPLSPSLPGGRRMRAKGGCASAFLCRAQSLMLMGRKRQAWDAFAGVLRSRPSDAETLASLWSMGSLAEDAGRLGLSVALFSRWAARERSARALVTLGWAQYRAGSHPDGLKTFMRALRMDPGDAQAFYTLARAEELFGRPEAAELERTVRANFSHSMRLAVSGWRARQCATAGPCRDPEMIVLGEERKGELEGLCTMIFEGGATYGGAAAHAAFDWGIHQAFKERSIVHCTIPNARLSGNGGAITDEFGRVYPTIHAEQVPWYSDLPLPSCARLPPPVTTIEEAAQLTFVFGSGYYHWLIDAMPRLALYLQRVPKEATFLVPADSGQLHPFMSALLDLFKVRRDRVTFYPILPVQNSFKHSCTRFHVRKLHLIDWKQSDLETRKDLQHLPPRAALRFFRRIVLFRIPERRTRTLQVYVQRSRAADRRVRDEDQVLSVIHNATSSEIVTVTFGDAPPPPMREAIYLFSAGNIVVGMHGAGLANAVFMKDGGSLVEFALPQPGTHCYVHLAMAMGLSYWQVPVLSTAAHGSLYSPVDTAALQETLAAVHAAL